MRVLTVLLAVIALPLCAQDFPGEVVANPGFDLDEDEDGLPDSWNTGAERVLYREKVFMSKDYEIVSKPGAYVLATQDIRLEKGQLYTVTLRCKVEEDGLAGALILHGEDKPRQEMPILWNLHTEGGYEECVGTFTAPNPVARLYIYNVARSQGKVFYDRVSIRAGEPDHPVIGQMSFRPIDRPLTPPLESRHIDWASPLAGGPIKAFMTIRNFRCLRQLVELTQRIDLDYDVVDTGYYGKQCVSPTGRRAMQRIREGEYEVYVIPSRTPDALSKAVVERVQQGAGLVIIEGFGQAKRFLDAKTLSEVDEEHYLRQGIPWDLMPEKILSSIQTGTLGQGRVARLNFPLDISRVWGLIPTENSYEAYKSRQFEYWEWWEALLARAIAWAARRDNAADVALASLKGRTCTLRVTGAPQNARLRVTMRSAREIRFDGPLLRTEPVEYELQPDGTVTPAIPETFPMGDVIIDAVVLNGSGEALTWTSLVASLPQAARLQSLSASEETYRPQQHVQLTVTTTAENAVDGVLRARLIDAYGRVTARTQVEARLPAAEGSLTADLPISAPMCVHHKAFVQLMVDGREQDSRWVSVLVPQMGAARAREDFLAAPWAPGMSHPMVTRQYAELTRELGLNGEFASNPHFATEHGKPAGAYIGAGGVFRALTYTEDGVRTKCLSDPAVVEEYCEKARSAATAQLPYGLFAAGISDEISLTSRHKLHEVCFSNHCQARYRQWLEEQYGSIDALNRQWQTEYTDWDQITGARTEEARGTANYAPFVDFRTFMTHVWVQACKTITDAYHETAPGIPVGHTNSFGANPFNGNDYWKLCTQTGFGWGQEYSEAIKASGHKAIFDLWRSFVDTPQGIGSRSKPGTPPAPFFNYGWIGYSHTKQAASYEPWWLALHGSRGVSYFATNAIDPSRGVSWALVYPTLSFTPFSMAVKDALADLHGGCGKLLMEYERERPSVGMLWSHPSMLVSWCESSADEPVPWEGSGAESYGSYFLSALALRQHINELQLDYTYLAPEQMLSTEVLEDYPVLLLPFTTAASGELVDRLVQYVEQGGILVGDLRCLATDEHGTPWADREPLQELFGVTRTGARVDYSASAVTFGEPTQELRMDGAQAQVFGREALETRDGVAVARHETGEPAVIVHQRGKGKAIYLNFRLPMYDVSTRELMGQILRMAGVGSAVTVGPVEGQEPPRCYERNTFSRGPITLHAFIRDHRRCEDTHPVRIEFGGQSHVYDMRARKYLGHTSSVQAVVAPGDTALYACLPYAVSGLRVTTPASLQAGEALVVEATATVPADEAGDHIFHIELKGPDGGAVGHYTTNRLARQGRLAHVIRLALNERPGRWTVSVRDVLSGLETTNQVLIEAGPKGPQRPS